MTTVGVVFARGGSKGLPNKNVRPLRGVPLVGRAVTVGLSVSGIDAMYCSSDSEEILQIARSFGAHTPFTRPKQLAADDSPELDSWKHFAQHLLSEGLSTNDTLISLPATAPLRAAEDVEKVLEKQANTEADLVVTYAELPSNPSFTTVNVDNDGWISGVEALASNRFTRRQQLPPQHKIVPVAYAATVSHVLECESLFGGAVAGVQVPWERSIDIDTEFDLQMAELLCTDWA